MPTVLRIGPYRFHFYSADGHEPPHIHVRAPSGEAKYWLNPVRFEKCAGLTQREVGKMMVLVQEHEQELLDAWYKYF